ncbi:MAG: glycosyltransferase family 2 protein [Candidatus Baltobacteraceae bacterium]
MTRNEARNLSRALESLPPAAPLLVVDAESSDGTVALAQERGAEIVVRPWEGFVSARRFALGRVRTPWTFMLDADESLDPGLREALLRAAPGERVDGYQVRRSTWFCGRPIAGAGWGEETLLRLFRTGSATLEARPVAGGRSDLHEAWKVPGEVETLEGVLFHHSYPTLASYREKFGRYTSLEAQGLPPSRVALAGSLLAALARAPWLFFVRGGWRDGWRGAFISAASAFYPAVARWKALRK